MWTASEHGFYSAVVDESDETRETLVVRTRAWDDAEFLVEWLLAEHGVEKHVMVKDVSDYPWRVFMSKELWASYLVWAVDEMSYTNFKNRVAEVNPRRAKVYGQVWYDMLRVEDEDLVETLSSNVYEPRPATEEEVSALDLHNMTDAEWAALMEEAPAPAAKPKRKRKRKV